MHKSLITVYCYRNICDKICDEYIKKQDKTVVYKHKKQNKNPDLKKKNIHQ